MRIERQMMTLSTEAGLEVSDLTPRIRAFVDATGIVNGFVIVASRHTTTALTINENEPRLLEDLRRFLGELVPPDADYLHNDIHLRDCPPDEPLNAHSHIAAMLLGSTEAIPLADGDLVIGQWQSVLLIELDGPRERTVTVQVLGE